MSRYFTACPHGPAGTSSCTLCDFCANACGGCSWSQKDVQTPVPGWDAVRRDIPLDEVRPLSFVESYVVIHCPEFSLENHRARQFRMVNWDRVRFHALARLAPVDAAFHNFV